MINKRDKKFYNTYHDFMKKKFGCRVYKISIDAGFSCPNRDGKKFAQRSCKKVLRKVLKKNWKDHNPRLETF